MTEILLINQLPPSCMEALEADFTLRKLYEADDKDAFLAKHGPNVQGVATDGHTGCPPAIMDRLPKLEVIASYGVGYDAINVPACAARGVKVANTPEVLNDAVAELTLGMMIGLCRRIPEADAFVRAGRWPREGRPLTDQLTGAQVGILGLGRIGKEIARRCEVMRMEVSYCGRSEQTGVSYRYFSDLEEMAREVDWLVAIAPGTAATQGIVSRKVLEALGPNGNFVNVGRGSLVDEPAMVELLQNGKLGGAALDVFEKEPQVPEALLRSDKVVLSPHMGSATHVTRIAMGTLVMDNLLPGKNLYLIATGTGLAPFLSIIRDPELYERFDRVILTHGCRYIEELAYQQEITEELPRDEYLGAEVQEKLIYYPTVTREKFRNNGRLTDLLRIGKLPADVGLEAIDPEHDRFMVCGSPSMLKDICALLDSRGFRESRHGEQAHYVIERAFVES